MNYKDKFILTYNQYIKRDGAKELLDMICKSDFFTAPASTRFHDSCEGGLVQHSLLVFDCLNNDETLNNYDIETVAICALLHDLCKIGYYKTELRNTKDDSGKWIKVQYYTVEDTFPYGHGEKSVYLIERFMKLKDEEAVAIRWHMGAYSGQQDWNTLGLAYEQYPISLLLHIADMKATYLK